MIHLLWAPIAYTWLFWSVYVLVTGFYRAWLAKTMPPWMMALALPWLALGLVMDFIANVTLATVFFADLPREFLVTRRFQRYVAGPPTWRKLAAVWVCENMLDMFDASGDHC